MNTDSSAPPPASNSACRLVIVIALAAAILPALTWIATDVSVWPWDPAWYGEVSVKLYFSLTHDIQSWSDAALHAFSIKAPAIAWFGEFFVPLRALFGSFERALLCSIVFYIAVSLILTGRSFRFTEYAAFAALAGLLCYSGSPLAVGLSHQYFVEPLQILAAAWVLENFMARRSAPEKFLHLVLANLVGMVAKASTPLYVLPLSILTLGQCLFRRDSCNRSLWRLIPLCLLTLLFGAASVLWYWINWKALSAFVASTSSGPIAELYGKQVPFAENVIFWTRQAGAAFFLNQNFALLWLSCLALGFIARVWRGGSWSRGDSCAVISVLQIVVVLAVFALQINRESRYLVPLLPYVAFLTFYALDHLGRVIALPYVLASLIQVWFVNSYALTDSPMFKVADSPWLIPVERDPSAASRLHSVVEMTCGDDRPFRYNIVGLELPSFNANSASFYFAQHKVVHGLTYDCFYTSLGYAESDSERAWKRAEEMHVSAFVFLKSVEPKPGDAFNRVSTPILDKIRSEASFKELESSNDLLVFRRDS